MLCCFVLWSCIGWCLWFIIGRNKGIGVVCGYGWVVGSICYVISVLFVVMSYIIGYDD